MAEQLAAGRIGRPHGLDGSFYVTRPVAGLLSEGDEVFVGATRHSVVRLAGTAARPIVAAVGLRGSLGRPRRCGARRSSSTVRAPPLAEDEYRIEELAGCRVTDGDADVGEVTGVLALPSCEALEVRRAEARTCSCPLRSATPSAASTSRPGASTSTSSFVGE